MDKEKRAFQSVGGDITGVKRAGMFGEVQRVGPG